jgi:hypothetical protein
MDDIKIVTSFHSGISSRSLCSLSVSRNSLYIFSVSVSLSIHYPQTMFFPGRKMIFLLLRYAHIYLKHVFFRFFPFFFLLPFIFNFANICPLSSFFFHIFSLPCYGTFFIFLLPLKWLRLIPSVSDPDHFDTHPDPTFQFDTAPDLDPTVGSPEAQSYLAGVQWYIPGVGAVVVYGTVYVRRFMKFIEKSKFSTVCKRTDRNPDPRWKFRIEDLAKLYGSNPDPQHC